MNRKAFILGFYATGGQVLLLRELVASLNGDELFIGTALFGWLLWVAIGAFLGGKVRIRILPGILFVIGSLLLPLTIIVTKLSPLVVTDIAGEIIPFSIAALISIFMMLPVGVVSGWLFPAITHTEGGPAESIIKVYLFEGIGAFVGGVILLILVGSVLTTLQMSVTLGLAVIGGDFLTIKNRKVIKRIIGGVVLLFLLITMLSITEHLNRYIDEIKYKSYQVEKSFDTHYGHQTILSRDSALILLTDNSVEAVHPDLITAENILIPPLVYKPAARKILFIGRIEFGVSQLANNLPDISITAIDPRIILTRNVKELIPLSGSVLRIDNDPMSYILNDSESNRYDILILNTGELNSYRNSRWITGKFLSRTKSLLKKDGILYLPTRYDTDRFITVDEKQILSTIYNVFQNSFNYVNLWPGNMTLLFASDTSLFNISFDTMITRLSNIKYIPQFISENYLADRLDDFKRERLLTAVKSLDNLNSIEKPVLPHLQVWYQAKTNSFDRKILSLILKQPLWNISLPILIIIFLMIISISRKRKRQFGLFLYFTAGVVSLSLELISFYVYQSSAGSLYTEMAVLIGTFMLGLASGTYYTFKGSQKRAEYFALPVLLTVILIFLVTYQSISFPFLLLYHLVFLFITAAATGSLFVAATTRYYPRQSEKNRGFGYACELIGSSVGALFSTTILLPIIGLHWLLTSLMILIIVTFIGSLLTCREV